MPMLMSVRMRRWKEEMGRRSRRAPALTLKSDSLFPREGGHGACGEGFDGQGTIFFESVGLRGEEKVFAAAGGGRGQFQDLGGEGVGFFVEICRRFESGSHLRSARLHPLSFADR